jgi:hypothetical protein
MPMPLEKDERAGGRTMNHVGLVVRDVLRAWSGIRRHEPHENIVAMKARACLNVSQIEPHFNPGPVETGEHSADESKDVVGEPSPLAAWGFQFELVKSTANLRRSAAGGGLKPHFPESAAGHELCTLNGHRTANQEDVIFRRVNATDVFVSPACGSPKSLRDPHLIALRLSVCMRHVTR